MPVQIQKRVPRVGLNPEEYERSKSATQKKTAKARRHGLSQLWETRTLQQTELHVSAQQQNSSECSKIWCTPTAAKEDNEGNLPPLMSESSL